METIKLDNHEWKIDTNSPLGRAGGFGKVFSGRGPSGEVAIKRLKISAEEAAHREMNIGNDLMSSEYDHVVQVLDSGLDANSNRYYLVMPICKYSLQDQINDNTTDFQANEIISILLEILTGLEEVGHIVHRDIKPANILFHDGKWKLADFGIAKFVEDATSFETLRSSLTPQYAAPEQWRKERPTAVTDIYAVGCIAYALTTGSPPFTGDVNTIGEKHLNEVPAGLNFLPPNIGMLVSLMLRKIPETRPSRGRCIEVLQKSLSSAADTNTVTNEHLIKAVGIIADKQAKQDAANRAKEERILQRDNIFHAAFHDLKRIKKRIFQEVIDIAQDVINDSERQLRTQKLKFGDAILDFDTRVNSTSYEGIRKSDHLNILSDEGWGQHRKKSTWDIVAIATVGIKQYGGTNGFLRSANLIFAKPNELEDFRWYELSFFSKSQFSTKRAPYHLDYAWDIDSALSALENVERLAHPPKPIDCEDENDFVDYWINLLGNAAVGKSIRPDQLPFER
jgi:serine/threonine-protein kinase